MGRTVRTAKKRKLFLDGLRDGYSVSGAARNAGMGRTAVYAWRNDDPQFAKDWDDAWEARGDWYEDRNREAALNGAMPAILNGLKMHKRLVDSHHHTVDVNVQEHAEKIAAKYGLDPDRLIERARELDTLQ